MKAKDTVMTHKQRAECSHNPVQELREVAMCEAQAEISFKAGEKQGMTDKIGVLNAEYRAGKNAGIKEAVGFVGQIIYLWHDEENKPHICIDKELWQAKLKEWEIEGGK